MIVLDTSALLRFLSLDDRVKAEQVHQILQGSIPVHIPDVVFPELQYMLSSSFYNVPRQKIILAFQKLEGIKVVRVSPQVKMAISIFSRTSLDMADCIIIASAVEKELFSFDKKMMRVHAHTK